MPRSTRAVSCPWCKVAAPASAVDLERAIAKCPECGSGFRFEAQLVTPVDAAQLAVDAGTPVDAERGQQNGVEIERADHAWVLRCRWRDGATGSLGALGVAFGLFVAAAVAFSEGTVLAFLPHGSLAVAMVGISAYRWINVTKITVTATTLSVRHEPLPWTGDCEVPIASLRSVRVEESGSRNPTYAVVAVLESEAITLIAGLPSGTAFRIAAELERHVPRSAKRGA